MPIRPALRGFYPIDWHELSRAIRFRRAGGRCEGCSRPHGIEVATIGGAWLDEDVGVWRDQRGRRTTLPYQPQVARMTHTRLQCAHVDHDPTHNASRNLRAWCGRCHLAHDREEHRRQRRLTYLLRRAIGDLFEGEYQL